jgi:hypothetical protein
VTGVAGLCSAGQLPGLEHEADISGVGDTDFASAREAIAFAKRSIKDLDASLSQAQKAELVAFTALIEHKLDVAVEYNIWWEKHGYSEYAKVGEHLLLQYAACQCHDDNLNAAWTVHMHAPCVDSLACAGPLPCRQHSRTSHSPSATSSLSARGVTHAGG